MDNNDISRVVGYLNKFSNMFSSYPFGITNITRELNIVNENFALPILEITKTLKNHFSYITEQNIIIKKIINDFNFDFINQLKPMVEVQNKMLKMFEMMNFGKNLFENTVFNKIANGVVYNLNTCEDIANDSIIVTEKISKDKTLSKIEKRIWLRNFLRVLSKILGSGLFSLVLFLISPVYDQLYSDRIQPYIYQQEFKQIQNQNLNLDLRMIKRNTPLYKGKKMNSISTILEKYEIVIVLETKKDKLKIQIFESEEIGWIHKKYTLKR